MTATAPGSARYPRLLWPFCWGIGVVAFSLLIFLSIRTPIRAWALLLFFIPLTVIADSFTFRVSQDVFLTFEATVCLLCLLLEGPVLAAWTAAASAVISELFLLRRGLTLAARSGGMYILMWLIAGFAYQAVGGEIPLRNLELMDLFRVLFAFLLAAITNRSIMGFDRWLRGFSPWEYLGQTAPKTILIEMCFIPLGAIMAVTYTQMGLIALAVLILMLMLALAATRQLRKTSDALANRVTELNTLNLVGRNIGASLQAEDLLELIHRGASELIDTSTFWITLYDRERNELVYEILYDEGERYPAERRPYEPGVGLAAYLIEHREAVLTRSLEEFRRLPLQLTTLGTGRVTESILGVPMMTKGKVIGAIAAQSYQPNVFDPEDLKTLTTLANQAAVALENARLFREVEQGRWDLRAVLDGVDHAMVVTDLEGKVRLANRAMEGLFGVSENEAAGQLLARVVKHEALIAVAERIAQGTITDRETLHIQLSDGRALVAHLAPVTSVEGLRTGYVVAMADVTALHELNQLKSRMIRIASHDLRNPLHLAGGYFEMLQEELVPLTEQQEVMAERVWKNLNTMKLLIDDLLELERVEEQHTEPLDMAVILREVLQYQRLQSELKRQRLQSDIPAYLPKVQGDRRMLAQAITNLVDNAIKYTPEDGLIIVRAKTEQDEVIITVYDTGIGIPVEDQPHIFDQFYRARQPGTEKVSGTGLGLSLVKEIIGKHGGRVWVESQGIPGQGSTFGVALPIASDIR
jgi:PAS domain S-box-containing protein